MAKKQAAPKTEKKDIPKRVFCKNCQNSDDFGDNSCFCKALGHRVCAANRYGKPNIECRGNYKPKNNLI